MTLADSLGRKTRSKWVNTSGDGAMNVVMTVLAFGLSVFLVETAFVQCMGFVPAA